MRTNPITVFQRYEYELALAQARVPQYATYGAFGEVLYDPEAAYAAWLVACNEEKPQAPSAL